MFGEEGGGAHREQLEVDDKFTGSASVRSRTCA